MMEFILVMAVLILFILFFVLKNDIKNLEKRIGKEESSFKKGGVEISVEISNKNQAFQVGEKTFSVGGDKQKSNDAESSEYKIGSKFLPAIGIISILIGLGFFFKDYMVLSDMGKVMSGFIFGVIFIALGERIREKYLSYSTFLIGGGFAILYLSAKFGLVFDLYSNAVAFILMVSVTGSAAAISFKLNSRIVSIIAMLGGFLAPILVSIGQANEIVLFNYITVLLAGMIFLAWKRGWMELVAGSLVGTMILYGGSMAQYYTNLQFSIYWIYLLLFFTVFTIAPFLSYFSKNNKFKFFNYLNMIIPVIVGGLFMSLSYFMFEKNSLEGVYFVIGLIPTVVYLALSKISLQKLNITIDLVPVYFFVSMATFSIAMIPALHFLGIWITFAWFIEALVLAAITFKTEINIFLNISIAMLSVSIFRLFVFESDVVEGLYLGEVGEYVSTFTPILNERFLIFAIGICTVFVVGYFALKSNSKKLAKVLGVIGSLVTLSWIAMEVSSVEYAGYISSDTASLLLSLLYLIYAGVLMYVGVVKKWSGFRIFAIVIFSFVILKAYLLDIWILSEIWRISSFIILGLAILSVGYLYSKNKKRLKDFLID